MIFSRRGYVFLFLAFLFILFFLIKHQTGAPAIISDRATPKEESRSEPAKSLDKKENGESREEENLKNSLTSLCEKSRDIQNLISELRKKIEISESRVYHRIANPTIKISFENEEVQYDLRSIQYNEAYIQQLSIIKGKIETAIAGTSFLINRISTDLMISSVIGQNVADKMRDEIAAARKENIHLYTDLSINNLQINEMASLQSIWDRIYKIWKKDDDRCWHSMLRDSTWTETLLGGKHIDCPQSY